MVNEVMGCLGQLPEADPYQLKALLRTFISRIKIVNGQIAAIIPAPWAEPLFLALSSVGAKFDGHITLDMFVILG